MSLPIASRTRCIFERYPWISADCTSARLGMPRSAGFNTAANDLTTRSCDKSDGVFFYLHGTLTIAVMVHQWSSGSPVVNQLCLSPVLIGRRQPVECGGWWQYSPPVSYFEIFSFD